MGRSRVNKTRLLDWAETIDSYRVFPRLFLLACFVWAVGITHEVLHWYISLPPAARGLEGAGGFASVVELGVMGFLKMVYSTYSESGRNWNQASTTSTVASVTTTVPS